MRPHSYRLGSRVFGMAVLAAGIAQAQVAPDTLAIRQEAKVRYRAGQYEEARHLYQELVKMESNDPVSLKEAMWGFWNMGHYDEAADIARRVQRLHPQDAEAKNILAWAPRQEDKKEESSLRRDAVASYQARRYDESARLYRELAQMEPKNIAILKEFMWALWYSGQYDEASRVAERVNNLRPTEVEAKDVMQRAPVQITRQRLVELEKQAHDSQEAGLTTQTIALYKQLVALEPQNAATLRTLIWTLAKDHQYEEAKAYAFQLMTLKPHDPEGWNTLAKMQMALEQTDEAIASYQKSLSIDPNQPPIQLALGKYQVYIRDFDEAIDHLERVVALRPSLPEPYPLLAKAYYFTEQYAKARDAWAKAVALYPEETEFRFNHAQSTYYSGDPDGGIAEMSTLYAETQNAHARDFMVDDLVSRGDTAGAEQLLESTLQTPTQADEPRAMKLAELYQRDGRKTALLALLNRLLKVWPDHQPSLLIKGSVLYDMERFADSKKVYERYRHVNAYATGAWSGIAACQSAMGDYSGSLKTVEGLRRLDPTNPYTLLLYAQTLYEDGRHERAKRVLKKWLKENRGSPYLPVILYHDLTPRRRDPVLAYPYHHSVQTFDEHMKAIHDAGYTPVTAEDVTAWLQRKKELPPKPILIAFDDNRRDSFKYADPILEKYSLKATMFVAIINVEYHHPPAFVSWDELRHYQNTGRWELEAHGDLAHIYVPATSGGGKGLFLMNRKWLEEEHRHETMEEWKARIEADHESVRYKLEQNTGHEPSAYAWPEGLFGQQGNTNSPETTPINIALMRKNFAAAYTQDNYGLNVRSKDPAYMTRIIPNNTWSGKDLIRHFTDRNPYAVMQLQLLEWANAEGHMREAMEWLHDMKGEGVSEPLITAKESEIRFSAGDLAAGQALATRLAMLDNSEETQKSIKAFEAHAGPEWTPSFTYQKDNRSRIGREFMQTLSIPTLQNVTWRLSHFYGNYSEPGIKNIENNGVGAGLDAKLGLFNSVSLDLMGHALPDAHDTTVTGEGRLVSLWTDTFKTQISAGRSLYDSARALNDDIASEYVRLQAQWTNDGWDVGVRGYTATLSDRNTRWFGQGTASRALNEERTFRLVGRFTYDAMRFISPDYYSPQDLRLYEAGPEFAKDFSKHVYFYVRYLPGYGVENDVKGQLVHDVETNLRIRFTDTTSITPSFAYQRTPTYYENIYTVEFNHVF